MKITYSTTIKLTDREVEFLKKLDLEGRAEFRDSEYETLEAWKARITVAPEKPDEYFLSRNFGGYYVEAITTSTKALVELDLMAWYETYTITDEGYKVLQEIKKFGL